MTLKQLHALKSIRVTTDGGLEFINDEWVDKDGNKQEMVKAIQYGVDTSSFKEPAPVKVDTIIPTISEPSQDHTATPIDVDDLVYNYIRVNGPVSKKDVLTATGISDSIWNKIIKFLVYNEKVVQEGVKKGARYRVK